jgi:hypothetical protein
MRHGVCAEEGLRLVAASHLSKTTKGGAPQATEIKSYDNVGHPPAGGKAKVVCSRDGESTGSCFSSREITDDL